MVIDRAAVPIGRLSPDRHRAAGRLLAAEYADYAPWCHVFPDRSTRARALEAFMTDSVRDACSAGEVDAAVVDGRLVGVALWLAPGRFPWSTARQLRATPALLGVLYASPRAFPAFARMGRNAARHHPSDRHWLLCALGAVPEAGEGVAEDLVRTGLARADRDGVDTYLTTARAADLDLFGRCGFRVERCGLDFVEGGPTHWALRRSSAARDSPSAPTEPEC